MLVLVWVVIYGVLLGVGTSLFVTAVLCPLFPSQFIIPQMIDTIEEIRNMYSVCALYIKTASDPYQICCFIYYHSLINCVGTSLKEVNSPE